METLSFLELKGEQLEKVSVSLNAVSGATYSPLWCHHCDALPPLWEILIGGYALGKGVSSSEMEQGIGPESRHTAETSWMSLWREKAKYQRLG